MATGTFTISMGSYYSKSKELKRKTEATIDDVQQDFIQRVHSHLSDVASEDRSFLEQSDAYTSAKRLKQQIEQKHLKKANEMSTESARNPLHPLIECDDKYASKLKAIADNKNEADVNKAIQKMKTAIETEKVSIEGSTMLQQVKGALSSDEYKSLAILMKMNPQKALADLMKNKRFFEQISKNATVSNFFLNFMLGLEKSNKIPKKLMENLFDNNKFYDVLVKTNPKMQGKILDVMIRFQEKGYSIGKHAAKYIDYFKKLGSTKFFVKFSQGAVQLDKLKNTWFGKCVAKSWVGTTIVVGASAINSYADENDGSYNDVGKALIGGGIDYLASIGPITGALAGARLGPWGALGGFVLGGISQGTQFLFPGGVDWIKGGLYKGYDKVSEWGQGVKQGVQSMTKKATNVGKDVTQKITNSGVTKKANQLANKVKDTFDSIKMPSFSWF